VIRSLRGIIRYLAEDEVSAAKHTRRRAEIFVAPFAAARHVEFLRKIKKSCGEIAAECP
jgi:hypothetical protein